MSTDMVSSAQAVREDDDTPELAKASEIPFNYEMRIETDILDPVVNTDDFVRFTLQKKGFLSHQSKVQLQLKVDEDSAGMYFPPLTVGMNSVIKRAVLKCGNRTLCETDEWARLQGYRSLFLTPENNLEREYYLTSRMFNYLPQYSTGSTPSVVSGTVGLNTGRNVETDDEDGGGDKDFTLLPFAIVDRARPEDPSTYSIYLGDLFDLFNGNNLPLYMIDDEVHIELSTNDSEQVRLSGDDDADLSGDFELDPDGVKLIYDTIYYDGETMEKYRRGKGSKLQFGYVDYRCTRRTGDAAFFTGGFDQNVGGAGRMVDKVIVCCADTELSGDDGGQGLLTNQYFSQAPTSATREMSINVRYNDRDIYTSDLDNLSTIFHETSRAEGLGSNVNVPKGMYTMKNFSAITENTIQGIEQDTDLGGKICYQSFKFERGERVNNQGITLNYTNNITGANDSTLFVWIALKKIATLENGRLDCYFV